MAEFELIEEQMLASRKKLSEALLKKILNGQESQSMFEVERCPRCEKPIRDK